jgi:glycosyltransferase involved in cell wall biosynthesis
MNLRTLGVRGGRRPSAIFAFVQQLPRLLLLSDEGPQTTSAGGLILFRLLKDYPVDRLQVIARRVPPEDSRLNCRYNSLTTLWRRFEQSRFHRWKRSLRAFGLVPPVPVRRVEKLLDGFQPDVVLCVMQHAAYYDTAWRFARTYRLSLIVIVHDVNDQFEPVLPIALRARRRRDTAFYNYASARLCVSPEMEELCTKQYGATGEVMYPIRSDGLQPRAFEDARTLKSPGHLTIGFVGNLNYGYGDELLRLLPAFRAVGAKLIAFSNPPRAECAALLDARDCFDFRGFAPGLGAWQTIQAECDAVILPYPNSSGRLENLYRYHFPSKLPEYLALGMPVVVTGPDYATGVKWALRNPNAVMSCAKPDVASHIEWLKRLRSDTTLRVSLAEAGGRAGLEDFDPTAIKNQFLDRLQEVSRRSTV